MNAIHARGHIAGATGWRHIGQPYEGRLARLCREALIAEAELTPKPGLVDQRGPGAHTDLSLELMRRSARAIEPYFLRMIAASRGSQPSQPLRERLAVIGRDAEQAMLDVTGQANAHKGAIWTLGLLVSAASIRRDSGTDSLQIAATAGAIACFADRAVSQPPTHGGIVERRYGATGARGEARLGFPHVLKAGLPVLRARRAEGLVEDEVRLDVLVALMARLEDTCVLYRGGRSALQAVQDGAAAIERAGGCGTAEGRACLARLDQKLVELQVSPGGSADLLAAVLLLDAIENGRHEIRASHWEDTRGNH